jgi:beta-phosphoglucomutase
MQKPPISLCIFDLDGVIVDTAKYHYIAWKRLAAEFGYDLTEAQNENLKGVSRVQSLDLILEWAGVSKTEAERTELATRKNNWYVDLIQEVSPADALPGVVDFIHELKNAGIKVALGSASKNARVIIAKLELTPLFDAVVDGTMTTKGKPDPEVFFKGAELTNTPAEESLVFEDAAKGIDAALAGGMYAVGIGEEAQLGHADFVLSGFTNYTLADFLKQLSTVRKV